MRGIYVDDGRSVTKLLELGTRFNADEFKYEWCEEWLMADQKNYKSTKKLTETEILRAMNSINVHLQFTRETKSDFDKKRLRTLSFEFWSPNDNDKSSMPENSKFSISLNELNRSFEVMDCINEMMKIFLKILREKEKVGKIGDIERGRENEK